MENLSGSRRTWSRVTAERRLASLSLSGGALEARPDAGIKQGVTRRVKSASFHTFHGRQFGHESLIGYVRVECRELDVGRDGNARRSQAVQMRKIAQTRHSLRVLSMAVLRRLDSLADGRLRGLMMSVSTS